MGDENDATKTECRKMVAAILTVIIFVVIIAAIIGRNYERTKPQSFTYVYYGDCLVRVDTATRVMYLKNFGPIIDPIGNPILYKGKFPWQ